MYKLFETLTDPFPNRPVEQPPTKLWPYFRYYCRGFEWLLAAMALCTMTISAVEVWLYNFLGQMVDWLSIHTPETLLRTEWPTIMTLVVVLVLVMPIAKIAYLLKKLKNSKTKRRILISIFQI